MVSLTPDQRALRARVAAHSLHAKIADPAAHTAPARRAVDSSRPLSVSVRWTSPQNRSYRRARTSAVR